MITIIVQGGGGGSYYQPAALTKQIPIFSQYMSKSVFALHLLILVILLLLNSSKMRSKMKIRYFSLSRSYFHFFIKQHVN